MINSVIVSCRFTFNVDTYSDTRNILTGVIDSSETLKTITTFFPKTLTWVLMRYAWQKNSQHDGDGSVGAVKEDVLCLTARTTHTETTTVMSNSIEVPGVAGDGRFTDPFL